MDFSVEFYKTATGVCPVQEFLEELRNRLYHREPLSKALGDGLYELRRVGKLNTRVLWFFLKDRRIVAVHAIRNKGQSIPDRDRETALTRMREWRKREEK